MIQEMVPLGGKTTMRIGGQAHYYADLQTLDDVEAAYAFAHEKDLPLIVFGNGSNTVFTDELVEAIVVRIKKETAEVEGNRVRVSGGKNLAMLINELAKQNLDLSALTGIPGTIGGAIFGNAGQGPKGIWIDSFVKEVLVYEGTSWKIYTKEECDFSYRESRFKHGPEHSMVIWEVILEVPTRDQQEIEADVQALLKKRIETQPHIKTAGSCFKAIGETPAWKLIDAAGLRGLTIGGVQIAEKHANFLLNTGTATYADAKAVVDKVKSAVKEPLDVEMRFIEKDGSLAY